VLPFRRPALYPAARRTLLRLAAEGGRFGIVPSEGWPDADPWTAPTAWSAWSLAALARLDRSGQAADRDRAGALRLLADLRRAATPAGLLPERVDARSGVPRSTTPLAWSHAFAALALRRLWPPRGPASYPGADGGASGKN
jgi:GH15 family glucan-1,4-alpha-glucosidase